MDHFEGWPVVVTETAVQPTWIYPKERFWEYIPSPETERWCRFFGYGREEMVPCAILVGGFLHVHPAVWEKIKAYTKRVEYNRTKLFEIHDRRMPINYIEEFV